MRRDVQTKKKFFPKIIPPFYILLFVLNLIADYCVTRGPTIGEIYFLGLTLTDPDESIYHSTDFGETAVCVKSISWAESICADKTLGGLYSIIVARNLHYSSKNHHHWAN